MVTFNNPSFLLIAAVALTLFLGFCFFLRKHQKQMLGKFGQVHRVVSSSKNMTIVIYLLALISLSLAGAEPWVKDRGNSYTRTLNAVIVLDVSRSMLAADGPGGITRLEMGIRAAEKLLKTYPDGSFGLVFYTDERSMYAPTSDRLALITLLDNVLKNYQVRGEGSDPVSALLNTVKMIEETTHEVKAVFLISDGGKMGTNIGPLLADLDKTDIHLVVAGVGDLVPVPIPVYDENRELLGYHKMAGSVAYTALEELFINTLADGANGDYLRLKNENDLVDIARSRQLDTQPLAQQATTSLMWLPILISMILILAMYVGKSF